MKAFSKNNMSFNKSFEELDRIFPKRIGEYYRIYLKGFNPNNLDLTKSNIKIKKLADVVVYLHSDLESVEKGQMKGLIIQINKKKELGFSISDLSFTVKVKYKDKVKNIEDIIKLGRQCWKYSYLEEGISSVFNDNGLEQVSNKLITELYQKQK